MNLIYQYYYDFNNKSSVKTNFPYYEYSKQSIRAYCEQFGIEYKFLDQKLDIPFYGIFIPFQEGWCKDYENICFVDSDVLATTSSSNIFEWVSNKALSLNFMSTNSSHKYPRLLAKIEEKGHANTGIVNFPARLYGIFSEYVNSELDTYTKNKDNDVRIKNLGGYDQAFINLFLGKTGLYYNLSDRFNWHMGRKDHNKRWQQTFIHYHRRHKSMIEEDFKDSRILK